MTLLFQILRAGHASGTHHKLALDALARLDGAYAARWQRLILAHGALFLEGAKAPDTQFKDFKNHVLHVRENLWGGAREKAVNWYQHLLAALRDQNWSEAAWCAGVLSHYYTDPLHPFHTGQTAAENNVHRAVEWSISRSYDRLAAIGAHTRAGLDVTLGSESDWLERLIVEGATRSNRQYEALLAHYDFKRGVVDPPTGLDETGRAIVAEIIQYAVVTFSLVLQRAFRESAVVPPEITLAPATLLAAIKLPAKAVLKRIDDRALRRQVEAMYDELQATGRVDRAMPEEERVVQMLHAKEVLRAEEVLAQPSVTAAAKFDPQASLASAKPRVEREARPVVPRMQPSATAASPSSTPARPVAALRATPAAPAVNGVPSRATALQPAAREPVSQPAAVPAAESAPAKASVAVPAPSAMTASLATAAGTAAAAAMSGLGGASAFAGSGRASQGQTTLGREKTENIERTKPEVAPQSSADPADQAADATGLHLTPAHDVVDGPSIGPKTADRLKAVGIKTVADLFAADPGALAEELDVAHIRAKTISEWQDQARLVCEVPGLRGTHAQLLVGAGYRDLRRIARAEPRQLSADVLKFAQSTDGQRILRSGGAPDIEKIVSWVQAAERVWAAKAA